MKINIASKEIVHFIGIGGIGMSGLAQIMHNMGFSIQGSDLSKNKNTERLTNLGIKVYFGHNKKCKLVFFISFQFISILILKSTRHTTIHKKCLTCYIFTIL